jgi:putative transposase
MNALGNREKQDVGPWANDRAVNSHLPFRRRERAMLRFRQMKTLQKFASVHANIHNHFSLEHHLINRETYKNAAPPRWRSGNPSELSCHPQRPKCVVWRSVRIWTDEVDGPCVQGR